MKKFSNLHSLLRRRAPSLLLPSLCIATALMVQGCPSGGSLENKDEFLAPVDGVACDPTDVFLKCSNSICHQSEDGMPPGGSVDFFAPGFGAKLIDLPATYAGVVDTADCPETPELIIDSANPSASLLFKKVEDTHSCGSVMPIGAGLSTAEIDCLKSWADDLIKKGGMGTGGGAGTGGAEGTGGGDGTGGADATGGGDGTGGTTGTPMDIRVEPECALGETASCDGITGSSTGEPMLESDPTKVGYLSTGVTLTFEGVNVEGLNAITFNYAQDPTSAGGTVEVHLTTADGMLVGTFTPEATASWTDYQDATINLTAPLTGTQTIVLVFMGESVCNLDWFEFQVGAAAL